MAKPKRPPASPYPPERKRRTAVSEPLAKATYQLTASVVEEVRAAVKAGAAPSASVLVEEAVRAKLRELARAERNASYAAAMRDPAFRADLDDTTAAFDETSGDGLPESRPGRRRR